MEICQSCGLPLSKDPQSGGTMADGSKSMKYCSFCFQDGHFTDAEITLDEKIEKNIQIAVQQLHIPEAKARQLAENILPSLERWKI